MRWTARVGERVHQVELIRGAAGRVSATVDGRAYELSFTQPQPLLYSILAADGTSHEAIVHMAAGRCRVRLGARSFDVSPEERTRFDLKGATGARDGRIAVRAVMPGRVLRVLVQPGQAVTARQGLVVIEAMKMENELTAPREGVVREIKVEPGRTVESGDPLLVLE